MPQIATGKPIPLTVFLEDEEENLFPLATLKDDTGSEIAEISLQSVGGGEYHDNSFTMPASAFVTAEIRIFKDAGHSLLSRYKPVAAIFTRDDTFALIMDQLISKINGLNLPSASISARLVQNKISGSTKTDQKTSALAQSEKVSASVKTDQKTAISLNDNEINVEIKT